SRPATPTPDSFTQKRLRHPGGLGRGDNEVQPSDDNFAVTEPDHNGAGRPADSGPSALCVYRLYQECRGSAGAVACSEPVRQWLVVRCGRTAVPGFVASRRSLLPRHGTFSWRGLPHCGNCSCRLLIITDPVSASRSLC